MHSLDIMKLRTMTCDANEVPPIFAITGAVKWMSAKVVMNGAEPCAILVKTGWVATATRRRNDFSDPGTAEDIVEESDKTRQSTEAQSQLSSRRRSSSSYAAGSSWRARPGQDASASGLGRRAHLPLLEVLISCQARVARSVCAMSSSRSSSASPEPEIVAKKAKKSKDKPKKVQAVADVDEHGKNEGDDLDLAYKPPEGFVPVKHKNDEGDFDWDAINGDDNLELWVVRVPDGVRAVISFICTRDSTEQRSQLRPKHLEGVTLEAASSSTARIGAIERKHTIYDVWSLGEDGAEEVGGDELRAVSCLLPRRKKDGKLYQGAFHLF